MTITEAACITIATWEERDYKAAPVCLHNLYAGFCVPEGAPADEAREKLPDALRWSARKAEAILMAAALEPGADVLLLEAGRRAAANLGDRYLKRPGARSRAVADAAHGVCWALAGRIA